MTLEGHETAEVGGAEHTHAHTAINVIHASSLRLTLIFIDLHSILILSEQKLNCKEIIEGLAKVLKKHTGELTSY